MEGDSFRRHRFPAMCHFNPLPPHGGRRRHDTADAAVGDFNPLPPHGGRQIPKVNIDRALNFNPLPPHGGRRISSSLTSYSGHFNPLPPHGGRHRSDHDIQIAQPFQSTPSAWRETLLDQCRDSRGNISIHSLRMEGDKELREKPYFPEHFNPLPPHGGRHSRCSCGRSYIYFNPLPPHGGRPCTENGVKTFTCISIHSLRMEGDRQINSAITTRRNISIHSLRMEGDEMWRQNIISTTPISIHSLRMEGDCILRRPSSNRGNFNPLPPHGGRRITTRGIGSANLISIHSLRMEGDSQNAAASDAIDISIHSLRMEGDFDTTSYYYIHCISIHSLRMEGDPISNIILL